MRSLAEHEQRIISGAGDFYFTVRIAIDELSPNCIVALYDLISAEINHSTQEDAGRKIISSCTINDLFVLGSLAENGQYLKTEYF
jgi:hypothetical protein